MADDGGGPTQATETAALREALAAEHTAVWGYGVVGAAIGAQGRADASGAENAHRDVRDRLAALLDERKADPVPAQAAYELPFPVLSPVDAAKLAVVLEDGVAAAWVRVLDRAAENPARQLAVETLGATEVRAVAWRGAAGETPVTTPFPGLPD
jgi:hypothetical protein